MLLMGSGRFLSQPPLMMDYSTPRRRRRLHSRGDLGHLSRGTDGVNLAMSEDESNHIFMCPACGGRMTIASVTPRAAGLPRLLTFQCLDCQKTITIEDD